MNLNYTEKCIIFNALQLYFHELFTKSNEFNEQMKKFFNTENITYVNENQLNEIKELINKFFSEIR